MLSRSLLAAVGMCLSAGAAHGELLALLAGEYNNNEQVWQQELDGATPVPRRHWKFAPTGGGDMLLAVATGQSVGEPAWLFRLMDGGPSTAPRPPKAKSSPGGESRLMHGRQSNARQASTAQAGTQQLSPDASEISGNNRSLHSQVDGTQPSSLRGSEVLHTRVFPVQGAGGLSAADGEPACQYVWRRWEDGFAGQAQPPGNCPDSLPEAWRISSTHLWATEDDGGPDYQARRVDYYQGWIALQRQHIDPQAAEDDFIFLADLQAHNEGFVTPIKDSGQPTGYAVELARLTYQRTQVPILKLGLIEQATGKTLSYSWAGPQTERIGLNLSWVQSGWTKVRQR